MTEFKKYKLGDICDLNKNSLKVSDTFDTIEYLDTSSITENTIDSFQNFSREDAPSRAQRKVQNETIIFSTVRPNQNHFGLIQNPKTNLIVSSGFTTLDVKDKIEFDAKYLYYNLTQPSVVNFLQTLAQNSVSAYPSINPDDIGNLYLRFPEVSTQKKIASVLSNIDRKISANREINRNLEELAKQIYDYWFVQFDFPNEEGKPYKSSGGKMVWNDVLNRKIPDGWEVKKLGEVCNFRNGINYDKKVIGNKSYKIVNVRNISASSLFLNQNEFDIISLKSNQADNYLVSENSILIARSGCPGATRIIMNVDTNVIFCGFIICMENFHSDYKLYFAYCLKALENTSATTTGGSILQNVSQDTLKRISVIIPPKDIITAYNEKTLAIFKSQLSIQKEIEELFKLRDNLLPLLMNGQVTLNSCLSAD